MRRTALLLLTALGAAILLPTTAQAAPASLAASAAKPLAGLTIAIDPGHNGGNCLRTPSRSTARCGSATSGRCATPRDLDQRGLRRAPVHLGDWRACSRSRLAGARRDRQADAQPNDTGWGPCSTTRGKFGAKVHADLMISLHGDGLGSSQHGFVVIRPGLVKGYTDDILSPFQDARAGRAGRPRPRQAPAVRRRTAVTGSTYAPTSGPST